MYSRLSLNTKLGGNSRVLVLVLVLFFCGWFSKDASVVIGWMISKDECLLLYQCKLTVTNDQKTSSKVCNVYPLWCLESRTTKNVYRKEVQVAKTNVRRHQRKKMCAPFCTRLSIGVRGEKVKVYVLEVIVKKQFVHKKPFCVLFIFVFCFFGVIFCPF